MKREWSEWKRRTRAALARHVFAIGLSGPMSSSERKSERGGSTVESPFQSRFPKRWRREEAGSRKGRASEQARAERSGWGSSERAGETQIDRDARSLTPLTTVAPVDARVGALVTSTFTSYYWTTVRSPRKYSLELKKWNLNIVIFERITTSL